MHRRGWTAAMVTRISSLGIGYREREAGYGRREREKQGGAGTRDEVGWHPSRTRRNSLRRSCPADMPSPRSSWISKLPAIHLSMSHGFSVFPVVFQVSCSQERVHICSSCIGGIPVAGYVWMARTCVCRKMLGPCILSPILSAARRKTTTDRDTSTDAVDCAPRRRGCPEKVDMNAPHSSRRCKRTKPGYCLPVLGAVGPHPHSLATLASLSLVMSALQVRCAFDGVDDCPLQKAMRLDHALQRLVDQPTDVQQRTVSISLELPGLLTPCLGDINIYRDRETL